MESITLICERVNATYAEANSTGKGMEFKILIYEIYDFVLKITIGCDLVRLWQPM